MTFLEPRTIAAIATPPGQGGIGIIKLSGPAAIDIASTLFRSRGGNASSSPCHRSSKLIQQSHQLKYGEIINPADGQTVDEVLLSVMVAPHSYTCEDVVEINAHAGYYVLRQIYQLVIEAGAHPAEPGEFTKRAFLNGRIDLLQAEAVIDLINARSCQAAELAAQQLNATSEGTLLKKIKNNIVAFLAPIEATIDFPDDVEADTLPISIVDEIQYEILPLLEGIIHRFEATRYIREGLRIAIIGRPNVGKSSLLNGLVEEDRAIVSEIPGTTRDVIDADIFIHGIPVKLTDTAGLRDATDEIERIGIQKTKERLKRADIVLLVVALDEGITTEDRLILREIKPHNVIVIFNKRDLVTESQADKIKNTWPEFDHVVISAITDNGFANIRSLIFNHFTNGNDLDLDAGFIPNIRQKMAMEECRNSMVECVHLIQQAAPAEIIALEIRSALNAVNLIDGEGVDEAILDQIFEKFCIGK